MPETLSDAPAALKQLLAEVLSSAQKLVKDKDGQIEHLREQNALMIQRLFGRKSEQTAAPDSPQLEFFNEAESLAEATPEAPTEEIEEEVVAPTQRRGKRKPRRAVELPRVEVVHPLRNATVCQQRLFIVREDKPRASDKSAAKDSISAV